MISMKDGDRRIASMEMELARIQTEETVPNQFSANLVRDALRQTLITAASLADAVISVTEEVADDLDEGIIILVKDLTRGADNDDGSDLR